MESLLRTNPLPHLLLGIFGSRELRWIRAGVDVGQCDDGIGWLLPVVQKILDDSLQLVASGNTPIVRHEIQLRHLAGQPGLQEMRSDAA